MRELMVRAQERLARSGMRKLPRGVVEWHEGEFARITLMPGSMARLDPGVGHGE